MLIDGGLVLTAGALALLVIEVIKFVSRKLMSNAEFEFAPIFYDLLIPFLTAAWGLVFSLVPELGFPAPPLEELLTYQGLLQWFLAVLVELVLYNAGVSQFKEFRRARNGK